MTSLEQLEREIAIAKDEFHACGIHAHAEAFIQERMQLGYDLGLAAGRQEPQEKESGPVAEPSADRCGIGLEMAPTMRRIRELEASVLALTTQLEKQRKDYLDVADAIAARSQDATELAEAARQHRWKVGELEADLAALRRPGQAAQEARGWQPIETAPKDEDVVLLFLDGAGVQPGYWDERSDRWVAVETQNLTGGTMRPSHWRQLPDPPGRSSASGPGELK